MPAYNSRRYGDMKQEALSRPQKDKAYADYPSEQPCSGSDEETVPRAKTPADIFGDIAGSLDADKLLIAALLLLLMREGGDMRLILALGYILL